MKGLYSSHTSDVWAQFAEDGELLFAGYLLHYVPYFLCDATLFLHNYLPALYFKLLLLAVFVEHLYRLLWLVV